jgi:hypothetical protein
VGLRGVIGAHCYTVRVRFIPLLAKDARNGVPNCWVLTTNSRFLDFARNDKAITYQFNAAYFHDRD